MHDPRHAPTPAAQGRLDALALLAGIEDADCAWLGQRTRSADAEPALRLEALIASRHIADTGDGRGRTRRFRITERRRADDLCSLVPPRTLGGGSHG